MKVVQSLLGGLVFFFTNLDVKDDKDESSPISVGSAPKDVEHS